MDIAGEKPWHAGCPIKCTFHTLYKSPSWNCQSDIKIQVGHLGVVNKSTCWPDELSVSWAEPDQRISHSAGQALSLGLRLGVKVTGKGTRGKSHMRKTSNSVPPTTAGAQMELFYSENTTQDHTRRASLREAGRRACHPRREDNWIHGRSTGAHFTRNRTTAHGSLKDNTGLQREPPRGVHFAIKGTTYSKWDTLLCLFFPATAWK